MLPGWSLPEIPRTAPPNAFTLVELLVTISVIGILAALLLPALAAAKRQAWNAKCLSNQRQMILAWHYYAEDHGGVFPGCSTTDVPTEGWVWGELSWAADNTDNTNTELLLSTGPPSYDTQSLGPYAGSAGIYRCPADVYSCVEWGQSWPRVRSLAMNWYVGTATHCPCESGDRFRIYGKEPDITRPAPSGLFVFLDEHPDTINAGDFICPGRSVSDYMQLLPDSGQWYELPASYHNRGAGFSFADGHAEIHRWLRAATVQPVTFTNFWGVFRDTPGSADLSWVTNRMSAPVD